MCTVTFVPYAPRCHRIICNRDEQLSRPAALPPQRRSDNDVTALMPIDVVSAGTWLAVNDAGLAFVLLNRNPQHSDQWQSRCSAPRSRGEIIPHVMAATSSREAERRLSELDLTQLSLFRLLIDDGQHIRELISDGQSLRNRDHTLDQPLMFTSNGLGDDLDEAPRRELFNTMFAGSSDTWLEAQQSYHHHRWPDQPQLSVDMSRRDARTVSITTVNITQQAVVMRYHDRLCGSAEHTDELSLRVGAA
jgi:hypothetical protein